jgi:pimeloyl-ACP methyl ester carboxylesterase
MMKFLERLNKPKLAYVKVEAVDSRFPVVMFCGGYRSDMEGTKALYLEEQCKARGQGYVRFDYSGHGQSGGVFEDLTISDWLEDVLDVFAALVNGPVVIVGSSMGGWIVLLMALRLQESGLVRGLVGLAAAPDFTEEMFYDRLDEAQQKALMEDGIVYVPNDYSDEPYAFTRAFYEDGKRNLVLNKKRSLRHPVKLIQGMADKDVPWQTAMAIKDCFGLSDADVILIEGGDHRLSAPEQLAVLWDITQGF